MKRQPFRTRSAGVPDTFTAPIDQPFIISALVGHGRAALNASPPLRRRLAAATDARTKHNKPLMTTGDIYQLLLPGDNSKVLLPGADLNEVLNRNLQPGGRTLAGSEAETYGAALKGQRLCPALRSQAHVSAPPTPFTIKKKKPLLLIHFGSFQLPFPDLFF